MNYFISKPTECSELDIENIKTKLKKCKSKKSNNINLSHIFGLNYMYGGVSLYDLYFNEKNRNKPLDDYIMLLKALKNIFIGIKKLHENKIYHLDLKLENIVLDLKSTNPKCKLIDFGESIKQIEPIDPIDPIVTINYKLIGSPYFMSPEMYILINTLNNNIFDINDLNAYKDFSIEHSFDFAKLYDIINFFKYYGIGIKNEYILDIFKNYSQNLQNDSGCNNLDEQSQCIFTEYFNNNNIRYIKADIWSLGIILYIIYAIINSNKYDDPNIEINKNIILSNLLEIIKSLLIINPTKRPDAIETLKLYNNFLEHLLTHSINHRGGKMIYQSKKTKQLQKKYKTCKRKYCTKLSSNFKKNIKKCYKTKCSKQCTELQTSQAKDWTNGKSQKSVNKLLNKIKKHNNSWF